ncbi:MAG: L-aspartate oxidase [Bdellovibrionia bacterium]
MNQSTTDFLVVGSGVAGLTYALKVADLGRVIVLAKREFGSANSSMAQGGIAAVFSKEDSFENHIKDTINAGAGLCREDIVRMVVEQAPDRIQELMNWGIKFDSHSEGPTEEGSSGTEKPDLTREGGHSARRILHVQDHTGKAIHQGLLERCRNNPNIQILENHFAVDLITNRKIDPNAVGPVECLGAYVLDTKSGTVRTILSRAVVLATGGAGKVYLYTSNWPGATGDGIAMAFRVGARVANLEFMQFHPTCLYHPKANTFLLTEALRGEGAELIDAKGETFMKKYSPMGSLAPRDIVARSIDAEMKKSGAECVFLDTPKLGTDFIKTRFPRIYQRCMELGIDITKTPAPVVPAAHYLCGGVLVDEWGRTDVHRLFAVGETACSGLHGANRLASNSLLECVVYAHQGAEYIRKHFSEFGLPKIQVPAWVYFGNNDQDELIVIHHMWDEIRHMMWNYVGIVRSNKRLERAQTRIRNLLSEIQDYFWNFKVHSDVLELRNIALVAQLTIACALKRKESRGIHFNIDYPPEKQLAPKDTILSPTSLMS